MLTKWESGYIPLDAQTHLVQLERMATTTPPRLAIMSPESVFKDTVIKDTNFQLVTGLVRPDSKRRLTLGGALGEAKTILPIYNVYRNASGQIVLDPVKAIPVAEAWLWENPAALAAVRQGLKESAEGKTVSLGSFADAEK